MSVITAIPELALRRRHGRTSDVLVATAVLGFSAIVTQLALTRELIAAFSGDELTVGITLSCWLVLTAVGTWCGSFVRHGEKPLHVLLPGIVLTATLGLLELLLLRGGRDVVFLRGAAVDPLHVTVFCLVLLAPCCLGNGALLTYACHTLLIDGDEGAVGRVYAADGFGSIAGALVFTFLFANRVDHAAALCWSVSIAALVVTCFTARRRSRSTFALGVLVTLGFGVLAARGPLDELSTRWQYGSGVVYRSTSPYGRLVVTRSAEQLTFFENGIPALFTANAVQVDEIVHFTLAQRPKARSVLLIGGGVAGAANEVLRYPRISDVTCVEIDPAIVAAGRALLPGNLADPRIHVITDDGRRFVQHGARRFDAILIALPDPTTYQLNRFFTAEFFARVRDALAPGGVVGIACGHYQNFVSPHLRQLIASMRATLGQAFTQVAILPGGRVFFLAANGPLTRDISAALQQTGINSPLVNRDYLDATLTPDRLADMDRAAATAAPINADFRPVLYLLRLEQWLNQFAFPAKGFVTVLITVFVVAFVRLRAVPRMVFSAGFAGAALEMVLLIALQTYYGALYQQIGVVVAAFMTGLAVGAMVATVRPFGPRRVLVVRLGLFIAILAAALGVLLPRIGPLDELTGAPIGEAVILTATLLLGGCMGAQFAESAAITPSIRQRTAARVFSADLVGAAVGGLAASVYFIPAFGVKAVCALTAALNLAAALLAWWSHRDA